LQNHDQATPSRPPYGALRRQVTGGSSIAQLVPYTDNTTLFLIVLAVVITAAALLLRKFWKDRAEKENRERQQRLDYQPSAKRLWVPVPVPLSRYPKRQSAAPAVPEADLLKNCRNLQESLLALTGKYSLDSFTIATSDGLVFASSGGETAQVDAAHYSRYNAGKDPAGMTLFGLFHKGSDLTGIIRSSVDISPEIRKRIENDTKDILNRWI
jgi:hypothetical protein